jgi:hypothetical protein
MRLRRERDENKLKGNFELIYPLVSYYEELKVKERIAVLDSVKPSKEVVDG